MTSRTAVRDLVTAGVPDKAAMEITGHKTRAVLDRYHIGSESDKAQCIEKLAALRDTQTLKPRTVVSMVQARSSPRTPRWPWGGGGSRQRQTT